MAKENIPLGESGVDIPQVFETTEERLGLNSKAHMKIEVDIRSRG